MNNKTPHFFMLTSISTIAKAFSLRCFLLLWCLLLPVVVSSNDNLYTVQVPIYEDTEEALGSAKELAFAEVITKLTATKNSWNTPHIQASKNNIDSYFDNISQLMVAGEDLPYLRLKFNAQAINALIEAAGFSIWDGLRPKLIGWIVERDFINPFILASESKNAQAFIKEGSGLGLPIMFPIMDIEDTLNISALDIEAQRLDVIRQASARYRADIILIGTMIRQINGQWWLQGQILSPQNISMWQANAFNIEELAYLAMENIGEQLSEVYARQPTNLATHKLMLQVYGIDDINKYAQVQQQLQKLSRITKVQIHQVKKQTLTLLISHEGSKAHILANIDLIQQMQRIMPQPEITNLNASSSLQVSPETDLKSMLDVALHEEQSNAKHSLVPLTDTELAVAVYQWQQ